MDIRTPPTVCLIQIRLRGPDFDMDDRIKILHR